jgi:hypothetical protein
MAVAASLARKLQTRVGGTPHRCIDAACASFNPSRQIMTGTGKNSAKFGDIKIYNCIGFLHAINFS